MNVSYQVILYINKSDGRLIMATPIDPLFPLLPLLIRFPNDKFVDPDDIFDSATRRDDEPPIKKQKMMDEFGQLPCVRNALLSVCDTLDGRVRFSPSKLDSILTAKVQRLSEPCSFEIGAMKRELVEILPELGLIASDKDGQTRTIGIDESIQQEARETVAKNVLSLYLPPELAKKLKTPYVFFFNI